MASHNPNQPAASTNISSNRKMIRARTTANSVSGYRISLITAGIFSFLVPNRYSLPWPVPDRNPSRPRDDIVRFALVLASRL